MHQIGGDGDHGAKGINGKMEINTIKKEIENEIITMSMKCFPFPFPSSMSKYVELLNVATPLGHAQSRAEVLKVLKVDVDYVDLQGCWDIRCFLCESKEGLHRAW